MDTATNRISHLTRSRPHTVPTVAIACQGGGSHTAFTAGVLRRLLDSDLADRYQIAALSGTSGGAICAGLVWSGLRRGGFQAARQALQDFWDDLAHPGPVDFMSHWWDPLYLLDPRNLLKAPLGTLNATAVWWLRALPFSIEIPPDLMMPITKEILRSLVARHVQFRRADKADERYRDIPLFIGCTDIRSGQGLAIRMGDETPDIGPILASAAIPPLFPAYHWRGRVLWDGLFTRNPPIREFTNLQPVPDEIWVIQINPERTWKCPLSMSEIADRRNELSGNLSLGQELYQISKMNEIGVNRGYGAHSADGNGHAQVQSTKRYKPVTLRVVELNADLDFASKFEIRPAHIHQLMEYGEHRATEFLEERSVWTPPPPERPDLTTVSPRLGRERRQSVVAGTAALVPTSL